ncbi:CBS domain-containing protein [Thermodesulfovibrionales bacterium]|nr:CBS domain-containing protein [Thermodesulfovibrionales bacterium]
MDVITSHTNVDFDAFASVVAAKRLYPNAVIVFPGSIGKKVRDFVDTFHPVDLKRFKDISLDQIKRLIIVDTRHPDRIGRFKELLTRPEVRMHIYDHHPSTGNDIKGELEIIKGVGAASTIFAEIFQKKKILITPLEATILCLGIYEETGSLTYTSTTSDDLMAVAYLLKRGANLNIVSRFLKVELSMEELALLNEIVQSLREVVIHSVRVKIGKGTMEGFGDASYLAHKIMDMKDTDVVILLIAMADKILIVARSKVVELDVSQVLSEFGGGGHPSAASATIKDTPFEILDEKLIESFKRHVKPLKVAVDVMTRPVIVIPSNREIKEATGMMTRYGVNVLPVVEKDKFIGVISREVVEKALFHGFGKSSCLDFATIDVITASPDTPISDIEASMIEQNQRFVSVVDGDRIIGAITRTDILRVMYEDFLRKSKVSTRGLPVDATFGTERNISKILMERLPAHIYEFLRMAGTVAEEIGFSSYLVGGCVRDMLMGTENLDIDVVVEGDGIAFARKLGEKIGARVIVHQGFGTARIIKDSFKLDVATARTEYYESPASLPKVEISSIKKDLYRRDFTINALAVKLSKKNFGQLIDFFGGHRDLRDRVIRVLHNLAFVEDPTRAFRAIRFSERFGFKLTKHTENLIKLAVRMGIFEKLTGTRIYDELSLIFDETNPIKALKRLGDYKLLQIIHTTLTSFSALESLLQSVYETISWFELLFLDEEYDKGMIYIMAILYRLNREEKESALKRLNVPLRLQERIIKGLQNTGNILKLQPDNPVEIYYSLKGQDIEVVLFGMAVTQDNERKKAISHFLLELRNTKPLIKGDDLKGLGIPPGPSYSEILTKILNEKLMKRLDTKEEEIEFVKRRTSA